MKFIGADGYKEIESLSFKDRKMNISRPRKGKLSFFKKLVRFTRRAVSELAKAFRGKVKAPKKSSTKNEAYVIDRLYKENRSSDSEFSASAADAIKSISFSDKKGLAHSAPNRQVRAHTLMKKKAVLATVACLIAALLSCITVAGALEFPVEAANASATENKASAVKSMADNGDSGNSYNNEYVCSTPDEAVECFADEAYISIAKALSDEGISEYCGLYIDGELIGATNNRASLSSALEKVLAKSREGYDEETTTVFYNDVEIKSGSFSDAEIMSVEKIIANADGKFSIALSTDIVYTREIAYETEIKYDETKSVDYKKVKTEGKNGKEKVTYRTTFVDGMQVDAVESDSKVITKAVDEVIIKGGSESDHSIEESTSGASYSGSGTFSWPLPYTHTITSGFEWRWGRMHNGIDIADSGVYGQPICASDGGTVVKAYDSGDGYGVCVIIDHGNGYQTLYGHCSGVAVYSGQSVSKGDVIGYVGSTGDSTGPHLHFEIIANSNKLNPLLFVG